MYYSERMKNSKQERIRAPENRCEYSQHSQLLTREGLEAIDLKLFIHLHRCHLKNANLSGKRVFGYLTVENAIARNFCIQNDQGQPELVYASVDDLVNDGWVVD